jgi:hypothetical protein
MAMSEEEARRALLEVMVPRPNGHSHLPDGLAEEVAAIRADLQATRKKL